ncbi:MAG: hypothetical protein ABIK49_03460 [candidate division WOR-3 bacterium]
MAEENNRINLNRQFAGVLRELAASPENNPFAVVEQKEAEICSWQEIEPLLRGMGLSLVRQNQCRWFLREVIRLLCSQSPYVAQHIKFCIGKWQVFGLNRELLQLLVCEVYEWAKRQKRDDARAA